MAARGDNRRRVASLVSTPTHNPPLVRSAASFSLELVTLQGSRAPRCSSDRMGLLLLLTSSLLCSWGPVSADPYFRISSVTLSVKPGLEVRRDTNVTLRCQAKVIASEQEELSREYVIYKDEQVVYKKATDSPEDFLYHLPEARVSNNGKYKCRMKIREQEMTSEVQKLTVTGLSLPVLHLDKSFVTEGDDVTATCSAPGETGSFYFHFFDHSGELHEERVSSNRAEAKLRLKTVGGHRIHCNYTVVIMPKSVDSENSNTVNVTVNKLSITPVLEISPLDDVYEGDDLTIRCSFVESEQSFKKVNLILSQGTKLLSSRNTSAVIEHNMMAEATAPALTFECTLIVENVIKVATQNISVIDLFSVPTLIMSPTEVFQDEPMLLICRSERVATGRLSRNDLTYTLDPAEHVVTATRAGEFSRTAMKTDFTYTCTAAAKGIKKRSEALTVRPKVHVSVPDIWVSDRVILGKPVYIYCESKTGSLPITYTLWKGINKINTFSASTIRQQAYFPVTFNHTEETSMYRCEASNGGRKNQQSAKLNTSVIEPVAEADLLVLPDLADISEGNDLHLICRVKGTPPITFWWYRVGNREPLKIATLDENHADYHFTVSSKEQSGAYYCVMENRANNKVESNQVIIEVRMALWKKALIGGFLLLVASILVLVGCVLYFKSKRGPVAGAVESVWTHRKPESEVDEFSTVSNEPEVEYTEVVHPRPADPTRAAPPRKGTDTVYSELQNSPHGAAAERPDYGSVKYAELNGEHPELSQNHSEGHRYSDLPVPVD